MKMRKMFSLMLALMMVFTLAVGASAEGFQLDLDFSALRDWFDQAVLPELPEDVVKPQWDYEPDWPEVPEIPPLPNCPSKDFVDVDTARWYHPGVDFCVHHGIMVGTSKTTFEPYKQVTRAQLVTMLWRQAGSPASDADYPFKDVSADAYYADAVKWAYETGVVKGYNDSEFDPSGVLKRQDMAVFLYRYTELCYGVEPMLGIGVDLEWLFRDGAEVSGYAVDAVRWAVARGLILGENTNAYDVILNATGPANRAQIANVFARYCVYVLGWGV